MLRSIIVFRTAPDQDSPRVPVAVLVEDAVGVWVEPLPGVDPIAWWSQRGHVDGDHPVFRSRSIPRPGAPDHRKLEYFARMGLSEAMIGRTEFGPITAHHDASGSAPDLAAALARGLARTGH